MISLSSRPLAGRTEIATQSSYISKNIKNHLRELLSRGDGSMLVFGIGFCNCTTADVQFYTQKRRGSPRARATLVALI